MATYPKCNKADCFGNKCGTRCNVLSDHPGDPCPFYKTEAELDNGRIEAHNKLLKEGKYDLIEKYEYNNQRRGQW